MHDARRNGRDIGSPVHLERALLAYSRRYPDFFPPSSSDIVLKSVWAWVGGRERGGKWERVDVGRGYIGLETLQSPLGERCM